MKKEIKKIDANTIIVENGDCTTDIFSYDSHIVTIKYETLDQKEEIILYENWDYSPTTSKGRNKALNYLGFTELNTTDKINNSKIVTFDF